MKKTIFIFLLAVTACMSTDSDRVYKQADWLTSEEYKSCRASYNEEMSIFRQKLKAYEQKRESWDFDAAMAKYEKEMAKYEAGTRKLIPLRPSAIGNSGLIPMLPNPGKCPLHPPESWNAD